MKWKKKMIDTGGKRSLILGVSGSGKTFYFMNEVLPQLKRVIIFDPEEEFAELPGYKVFEKLDAVNKYLTENWKNDFKIVFVPRYNLAAYQLDQLSKIVWFMQEAYKIGKLDKRISLVVDELQISFPLHPNTDYHWFPQLIGRGRKRGVNLIGITQRPAKIGPDFRGNLDRLISLKLSFPPDWKTLAEMVGPDAVEKLKSAPQFSRIDAVGADWKLISPS
jgi:hypothetical protein